jgi:hypothetical protein
MGAIQSLMLLPQGQFDWQGACPSDCTGRNGLKTKSISAG